MKQQDLAFESSERILSDDAEAQQMVKTSLIDYWIVIKPGIILSNLLTTFAGLWVASHGVPQWPLFVWTLLGTALVMASGTVLNSYVERDYDRLMPRTKNRPLAERRMHPRAALIYGLVLGVVGLTVLGIVEPIAALLGFVGLFVYVIVYTMWLKRASSINTVVGAISGAMPPMIGWAAVTHALDPGAWALFAILFLWQPPHFLALAIRRADEYKEAGYVMLPSTKGVHATKKEMLLYTAALVPASLFLYIDGAVGKVYLWSALLLGFIWVIGMVRGFYVRDDIAWAKKWFAYSLVYLLAMMAAMMIDTI